MAVGERINPLLNEAYSDSVVTDESVSDGYRGAARIVQIDPATTPPLPTGAATAAKQDTGNTSLASIDSKLTNPAVVGNVAHDAVDSGSPVKIGGYASSSVPSSVSTADRVNAWFLLNGSLAVYMAYTLNSTDDSVTSVPPKTSTVNTPAIITSAGDVLAVNASRKSWHIQNLGTNPLFVRLATGSSTSVFHMVLEAGVLADDGNGGVWEDDTHTGVVSVAGTSPRCVVMER